MFNKILIANRGEIACRIMVTAQRLGIKTVAVYSSADRQARHVRMADEAVCIGGTTSAESYLRGSVIIAAALETGAEAIHPGYGFLSENPDFVAGIEEAGLVFIGPSAQSIRAMGLKDAAKILMAKVGVPVVPGYHGKAQDVTTLSKQAANIGYPVLIKARAGGGGKGMRLVEQAADFATALAAAKREAAASFGDDHCLIEKFIAQPRHIEVQIFGDNHGHVVHMHERDCTLQRRHQKLVEEAPAPGMSDAMRTAMTDAAITAAKAIDYSGAGTIEFIVDSAQGLTPDGFWFMEMNTRLQVEHPVSEAITGLDFVELQLRVAAGENLPVTQSDIPLNGHAIEVRICAEDAGRGFLPASGPVIYFHHQAEGEFTRASLRLDSALEQGDMVSPAYDAMIAKLISHADDRESARSGLMDGIANLHISPLTTNAGFLHRLLQHDDFASGHMDTGLIARDFDQLVKTPLSDLETIGMAALMAVNGLEKGDNHEPWQILRGFYLWRPAGFPVDLHHDGTVLTVVLSWLEADLFRVELGGETSEFSARRMIDGTLRSECNQHISTWDVSCEAGQIFIWRHGVLSVFERVDPLVLASELTGGNRIIAPMPGLVQSCTVKPGDEVRAGDALVILEAMKMEHVLRAPRDGKIANLHVQAGVQVSDGAVLLELEADDG